MHLALFLIFAVMAVAGAILVISLRSPVSSAIALIFVLCTIAGLFALVGALFVAALQVIVYAGAIMVLFLFIIMLLNIREEFINKDDKKLTRVLGAILGIAFLFEIGYFVIEGSRGLSAPLPVGFSSIELVAEGLFTKYLFAFEITSILLLIAIVGALIFARWEGKPGS